MATEEPAFVVSQKDSSFEVRDYIPVVVAEVIVGGDQSEAASSGFKLLAGYIFGGNSRRQSIAMTAPVVQSVKEGEVIPMTAPVIQSSNGTSWAVRFVMPKGSSIDRLPTPNDSRVHLIELPATRYAVLRFSGLANDNDVLTQTKKLKALTKSRGLVDVGAPSLARYDPPWTLWFLRRNEVWIPIKEQTPR